MNMKQKKEERDNVFCYLAANNNVLGIDVATCGAHNAKFFSLLCLSLFRWTFYIITDEMMRHVFQVDCVWV
jgi:hypothetical protein